MWLRKLTATTAGCIAMVIVGGCLSAVQIRINGELGHQLHSPLVAALISFLGGALCAWIIVASMPSARRALHSLRTTRPSGWLFTGGSYGAFYVLMTIIAGPIIGIAAATVSIVAGRVFGGLLIDRSRHFRHAPVTMRRLGGAILALVAVVVSQIGMPAKEWQPLLLLLLCLSGMALSLQAAVQSKLSSRLGSLPVVSALSFTLGTLLLLGVIVSLAANNAIRISDWPDTFWLYGGGALGVLCVMIAATAAPIIGVFRLVVATAAGQLVGALLLDYFLPLGAGLRVPLIVAAFITFAALWITRRNDAEAKTR